MASSQTHTQLFSPEAGDGPVSRQSCSGSAARSSRDPLQSLPVLPPRYRFSHHGTYSSAQRKEETRLRREANRTALAVSAMWEGSLIGANLRCIEGWRLETSQPQWLEATNTQRQLVLSFVDRHRSFCRPGGAPQGAEAFASLMGGAAGGSYSAAAASPQVAPAQLPRGALCPAVVSEMAMPEGGKLVDPTIHSQALAFYYDNAGTHILKHASAVDWEASSKLRTYTDPALRKPENIAALAWRMWTASMIRFSEEAAEEFVDLFTVVKTDKPGGGYLEWCGTSGG